MKKFNEMSPEEILTERNGIMNEMDMEHIRNVVKWQKWLRLSDWFSPLSEN
jgi:hypothetical protein